MIPLGEDSQDRLSGGDDGVDLGCPGLGVGGEAVEFRTHLLLGAEQLCGMGEEMAGEFSEGARGRSLIERLDLLPHPEGGFYRETYRAELQLSDAALSPIAR